MMTRKPDSNHVCSEGSRVYAKVILRAGCRVPHAFAKRSVGLISYIPNCFLVIVNVKTCQRTSSLRLPRRAESAVKVP